MAEISIDNTIWERVRGFVSELRVDARWIMRGIEDNKSYGSLRIVSHPDLPPGYLRAIFTYITSMNPKNNLQKQQIIEDYQISPMDMEVYSVDSDIVTETKIHEAPLYELQLLFKVKIFE